MFYSSRSLCSADGSLPVNNREANTRAVVVSLPNSGSAEPRPLWESSPGREGKSAEMSGGINESARARADNSANDSAWPSLVNIEPA